MCALTKEYPVAEALFFGERANTLYLRAQGHITAALCADLKETAYARLDAEPAMQAMYIDLAGCDYMDSTFMGLMVGFNKRLMKRSGTRLNLVKPTASARELLSGLGLSSLVNILEEEVDFPKDLSDIVKTKSAGVDLLLGTHENLMELSEGNRKKFAPLHAALKKSK
jgi:anti-anti-sigma factor